MDLYTVCYTFGGAVLFYSERTPGRHDWIGKAEDAEHLTLHDALLTVYTLIQADPSAHYYVGDKDGNPIDVESLGG